MGTMTEPFGPGPWREEPDAVDFEAAGFACAVRRVAWSGHLCGYVGIPAGHPWHKVDYEAINVECHGGLTFGEDRLGDRPEGETLWWVGFDCNHLGDLAPVDSGRAALRAWADEQAVYRNINYVRVEVERLAIAAKDALSGPKDA